MSLTIDGIKTEQQCRETFAGFYENETIRRIAKTKRWAVSDPDSKMPVSMDGIYNKKTIYGASPRRPQDFWTLDRIVRTYPQLSNNAFMLNAAQDDMCVIDIEKTCADDVREKLFCLPWLYGEKSLSGKGYHLIIDVPYSLLTKYPDAQKSVIKANTGEFEVLMSHWVTFTRDVMNPDDYPQRGSMTVEEVLGGLFASQKPVIRSAWSDKIENPEKTIEQYKTIMSFALNETSKIEYAENRFNGDKSRADFKLCTDVCSAVCAAISIFSSTPISEYPEDHIAFMVQKLVRKYLKDNNLDRDKYYEWRGDQTYLHMTVGNATSAVLRRASDRKRK